MPGTVTDEASSRMRIDPAASDHLPAPWKDVTAPPGSCTRTMASPPRPQAWGATTASAACPAMAASTALPPEDSSERAASVASGCAVDAAPTVPHN